MISCCNIDPFVAQPLSAYHLPGTIVEAARYGNGHINDTFCVVCQLDNGEHIRYILQGLSTVAFPYPEKVMENFVGITEHLREKIRLAGGDVSRETLQLIPTKEGTTHYTDVNGKVWRMMLFVDGTDCYQSATPQLFESAARAFGRFQLLLSDYPLETLHETIRDFHNTEVRFENFMRSVREDRCCRVSEVTREIEFIVNRKADCSVLMQALREQKLPLRVTHNDTKLNNILIDRNTGYGICVIDLDTTMPGLSVNDFGDAIRYGANRPVGDGIGPDDVTFDLALFEIFTKGFLEGTAGALTDWELYFLPWGARLMTLECGMRFLTDYLDGDVYFRTSYPKENLYRCRRQFKLLIGMEEQFEDMMNIVRKYR